MKKQQVDSGPGASQSSLTYFGGLVMLTVLLNQIMKLTVLTQKHNNPREQPFPFVIEAASHLFRPPSQPINTIVQLKPA